MLEVRVKQLENQAREDFRYNESLKARLLPFLTKEAAEKEDDDDDQQAWPSASSDDNGLVNPIRFPRVMHWLKCPICLNYLFEHKNGLLSHIESFINDAMSPTDVVEQHLHLSRLLDMQP
jgi:hypothetical protein